MLGKIAFAVFLSASIAQARLSSSLASPLPECGHTSPPIITWNGKCKSFPGEGVNCFSPARFPNSSDHLVVPSAQSMTWTSGSWALQKLTIEQNATVYFTNTSELFTPSDGCIVVRGSLLLSGTSDSFNSSSWGGGPGYGFFPPDPTVPLYDCSIMPGGFTPRICGPGEIIVSGSLSIQGLYAAVWAHTKIHPVGTFELLTFGTFFGLLENHGKAQMASQESDYITYGFGSFVNYGIMIFGCVQYGSGYEDSAGPFMLNVTNFGTLHFRQEFGRSPDVTITVQNYNRTTMSLSTGVTYVDYLYNYGMLEFVPGTGPQVEGQIFNVGGVMLANNSYVLLSSYFSVDGATLITVNQGSFTFGNGAGVDKLPRTKECLTGPDLLAQLVQERRNALDEFPPPLPLKGKWVQGKKVKREEFDEIKESSNEPSQGMQGSSSCTCEYYCCDVCGDVDCFCEAYHTGTYCGGYGVFERERWSAHKKEVELSLADAELQLKMARNHRHYCLRSLQLAPLPADFSTKTKHSAVVATRRYSFQHGSVVEGDIVTTEPVELVGTVTVRNGAQWFALTEFGEPIFVRRPLEMHGKGEEVLSVEGSGTRLILGIDSELSEGHGVIHVRRHASIFVPSHSSVVVSNHSIRIAIDEQGGAGGGTFHVDGRLVLMKGARDLCVQRMNGEGTILGEQAARDGC